MYDEGLYGDIANGVKFVADSISAGSKGVLKGIHGDANPWEPISCPSGRMFFVAVNNDPSSKDYQR